MPRVVLVCAAGVSGTFLASRMRSLAPELRIAVTSLAAFGDVVEGADVVLVAPQLVRDLQAIRDGATGVPVLILDPTASGPAGAASAVAAVRSATASRAAG